VHSNHVLAVVRDEQVGMEAPLVDAERETRLMSRNPFPVIFKEATEAWTTILAVSILGMILRIDTDVELL
jgi:hypothetical protein